MNFLSPEEAVSAMSSQPRLSLNDGIDPLVVVNEDGHVVTSMDPIHTQIKDHIAALDSTLKTFQGYSEESKLIRATIIAQIDALTWATKLMEVE